MDQRLGGLTWRRDDQRPSSSAQRQRTRLLTRHRNATFKSQLWKAKTNAAETSRLQTRLKEAITRADDAEKRVITLEEAKRSGEEMLETMVEEHGALVEERQQLERENAELETRISGLLVKKSSELLCVPDSDGGGNEVDEREGVALSSHRGGKKRGFEATKDDGAELPRTAKTQASASRRRRRPSVTPPPQDHQSDFDFDLPSDGDEDPRLGFTAQPVPRSARRSVREQT